MKFKRIISSRIQDLYLIDKMERFCEDEEVKNFSIDSPGWVGNKYIVEVTIESDSEEKANDFFTKLVLEFGTIEDIRIEQQRIAFSNLNTERIIEEIRMLKESIYKIAYAQNLSKVLEEDDPFQR